MLHKLLTGLFLFGLTLGGLPTMTRAATVPLADLEPGDLIRGQTFTAVYYYGEDGFRYVFPNDKTYFTWYSDFSTVRWISDADLGKIQIGGNATYKPGVKMIKINTDPKTYAVDAGGTLRWVTSEAQAISLYGANWNTMIDDVPDGFFSNYVRSDDDIGEPGDYSPSAAAAQATSISVDKNLTAATEVEIIDDEFVDDLVTIEVGATVKFVNNGENKHTATADDLDWGTGTMQPGGFYVRRFNEPGTYTYFCSYHPNMQGTIVVE